MSFKFSLLYFDKTSKSIETSAYRKCNQKSSQGNELLKIKIFFFLVHYIFEHIQNLIIIKQLKKSMWIIESVKYWLLFFNIVGLKKCTIF